MGTDGNHKPFASSFLLARHLEVFIPKPRTRKQEESLLLLLDETLEAPSVPMLDTAPKELLETCCTETHRRLLDRKTRWENVVFGLSTYTTDGYFLQLNKGLRDPKECWREQTLVLKFIITNYSTTTPNWAHLVPASVLLEIGATAGTLSPEKRSALVLTQLHYRAACDYILNRVAENVLRDERELWSQEWDTTLDRRKAPTVRGPIAESPRQRKSRLPDMLSKEVNEILWVQEYNGSSGRPFSPKRLNHKRLKGLRK
jgi:hypothetical protein